MNKQATRPFLGECLRNKGTLGRVEVARIHNCSSLDCYKLLNSLIFKYHTLVDCYFNDVYGN